MKIIFDSDKLALPPFFWLHIRKVGGTSAQMLLGDHYLNLEQYFKSSEYKSSKKNPPSFLQVDSKYWNGLINVPRVNLGELNYRRCLFAKQYLYKDSWDNLFSFAFSREPEDRVISMFYYLFIANNTPIITIAKEFVRNKKIYFSTSSKFDLFLDWVEKTHYEHNSHIVDRVVATHTAPIFPDVADDDGNILLKKIYRVDNLYSAINEVFASCGIEEKIKVSDVRKNVNKKRKNYQPSKFQQKRIEKLYHKDFEIYENAS